MPQRTETNIRFYTDEDLRHILNVSLLVGNGFKISKVANFAESEIRDCVLGVTESKTSKTDYVDRLLLMVLNFDNIGFYKLTNAIMQQFSFEEVIFKIFFQLLERIGAYWQVGSIFPAQEHFVSNIFRQKIISEIDKTEANSIRKFNMLFFLPEKELHEMSLLFYSYLAKKYGYNIIYLGQFVPFSDLRKIQLKMNIDYVFTAFINAFPSEKLDNYLRDLKEVFQHQKIFITGWQLQKYSGKLPRNVKIVSDYKEFRRFVS